jgi:hypothetical protein
MEQKKTDSGQFAECQLHDTRQTDHTWHAWKHTLPSVRELTLGKVCTVCRVLNGWHSANRPLGFRPLAPFFAVWRLWHSANALPSARRLTLGKACFADQACAESSLPSAALGKAFAECFWRFAECPRHSANRSNPVVNTVLGHMLTDQIKELYSDTYQSEDHQCLHRYLQAAH